MTIDQMWDVYLRMVVNQMVPDDDFEAKRIIVSLTRDTFYAGAHSMLIQMNLCSVLPSEEGRSHMAGIVEAVEKYTKDLFTRHRG